MSPESRLKKVFESSEGNEYDVDIPYLNLT